ncbi:hypothetical protein HanXRQr2_Chr02g0077881 [Helianthus annuus]|uniref:Uncharacterized protein n=1 Tax=Helianthus annuus TaxID=4232 RepID=A0A251VJF4_HELAN|nr:hypothetical protein HanXRQr2_Chr02g0077881 [Helianthus annuus]KAJ0952725.1 hypothetical protein HanPSC8_Chr02g0075661 [Helianthus annuus]
MIPIESLTTPFREDKSRRELEEDVTEGVKVESSRELEEDVTDTLARISTSRSLHGLVVLISAPQLIYGKPARCGEASN